MLYIIEEDKGDGWTRARKQSGEEGYVPTSYVEITMEKNCKGAVTYIWSYTVLCPLLHVSVIVLVCASCLSTWPYRGRRPAWTFTSSPFHPSSLLVCLFINHSSSSCSHVCGTDVWEVSVCFRPVCLCLSDVCVVRGFSVSACMNMSPLLCWARC